jgi:hypothetical protein
VREDNAAARACSDESSAVMIVTRNRINIPVNHSSVSISVLASDGLPMTCRQRFEEIWGTERQQSNRWKKTCGSRIHDLLLLSRSNHKYARANRKHRDDFEDRVPEGKVSSRAKVVDLKNGGKEWEKWRERMGVTLL